MGSLIDRSCDSSVNGCNGSVAEIVLETRRLAPYGHNRPLGVRGGLAIPDIRLAPGQAVSSVFILGDLVHEFDCESFIRFNSPNVAAEPR